MKDQTKAARQPVLRPMVPTLGTFCPKGQPEVQIPIKVSVEEGLVLFHDANGSLASVSDESAKEQILATLSTLDGQGDVVGQLMAYKKSGTLHITDARIFAVMIDRLARDSGFTTLDLRPFGIKVSPDIRDKTLNQLREWAEPEAPIDVILGTNQIKKS